MIGSMDELTSELREKFMRFREAYEFAREKLTTEEASGAVVACES